MDKGQYGEIPLSMIDIVRSYISRNFSRQVSIVASTICLITKFVGGGNAGESIRRTVSLYFDLKMQHNLCYH